MLYIFASAAVIMLASLSGAFFTGKKYGPWTEKNLKYLIAFSIGVFAVIIYGLLREAFEVQSPLLIIVAAIGGAATLELASVAIPKAHHHHAISTDHPHTAIDARRMLLGDAMHNLGDGIVLVPAFAIGIEAGLIAAAGILVHELVQEISEYFVLRETGYSNRKALALSFLASSTLLIGIGISIGFSSIEQAEGLLVAFAAGGFVHILAQDLIPYTIRSMKKDARLKPYGAAFLAGLALMSAASVIAPHADHNERDEDDMIAREG